MAEEWKDIKSYTLSEEEVNQLPQAIKKQREAHIEYIREMETKHPIEDDGQSCENLSSMIMIRAILDEVTRKVLDSSND